MAQSRIKTKWQLTIFFETVVLLLAFFTLGALWEYADTLNAHNGWMLKVGFTACEFAVGVWVWFHVWRRWVTTRLVTLGLATAMGIFLAVHAAAVSKYVAAKREAGANTEKLAGGLAQITTAGAKGIVEGAGAVANSQRQSGAPNTARSTLNSGTKAAGEVTTGNAKILADAALQLETQAQDSTFLSAEYLNGKMQAVVFVALLIGIAITALVFEAGKAEEDDDDDGIPNYADADSSYYDARRAEKWWTSRGQLAPHQLKQSAPIQPEQPPAAHAQPVFASSSIKAGFAPPSQPVEQTNEDGQSKPGFVKRLFGVSESSNYYDPK